MTWKPLFDDGLGSESEQIKEISQIEYRRGVLANLNSINQQLCLLNARFEDAFETHIEEADV